MNVIEIPMADFLDLYGMAESQQPAGMPKAVSVAVGDGRNALRLAAEFLARHRAAPAKDRMLLHLRSAGCMVWLAWTCACQAIVLRRVKNAKLQGGPHDVRSAEKAARNAGEREIAWRGHVAEQSLYNLGFMRGDIEVDQVERGIRDAKAALRALAGVR